MEYFFRVFQINAKIFLYCCRAMFMTAASLRTDFFELQEIRVRHGTLCGIKITEVAGKIPHDHAFYVLLKRTSWEVVLKIKMPRIKQCFASRFFFAFSKNRLMAYRMRSDRTTPQKKEFPACFFSTDFLISFNSDAL